MINDKLILDQIWQLVGEQIRSQTLAQVGIEEYLLVMSNMLTLVERQVFSVRSQVKEQLSNNNKFNKQVWVQVKENPI